MKEGKRKYSNGEMGDMREWGGYRNGKGEEKYSAPTEECTEDGKEGQSGGWSERTESERQE